jgi:hypothetical protein
VTKAQAKRIALDLASHLLETDLEGTDLTDTGLTEAEGEKVKNAMGELADELRRRSEASPRRRRKEHPYAALARLAAKLPPGESS